MQLRGQRAKADLGPRAGGEKLCKRLSVQDYNTITRPSLAPEDR